MPIKISSSEFLRIIDITRNKMPSDRLSKVHKQITKKKGKNPNLHEGSRDTRRLQSAAARDDKINRLSSLREKQNRHYCAQLS